MSVAAHIHFASKKIYQPKTVKQKGIGGGSLHTTGHGRYSHSYFWHLHSYLPLNSYKLNDKHKTNAVLVDKALPN